MSYISPEAQKSRFDGAQRAMSYWPQMRVTADRVVVLPPLYGVREFVGRMRKWSAFTYDGKAGWWWAPLSQIGYVQRKFAPRLHLSKGAWCALEDQGEEPRGRLLLPPEESMAVMMGETTREEILERARVELYGTEEA